LRSLLAGFAAGIACASAPPRDPSGCAAPAQRAEVLQVQIGRDRRQAEELAGDLLAQCRKGARMEGLQDRYSDAPPGTILIGPAARVPFRGAALCMRKNECALVRSEAAFHVLKRID